MIVLAGVGTLAVLVLVWAVWLRGRRRYPGRTRRRSTCYICERFAQRVRDWWNYVRARL